MSVTKTDTGQATERQLAQAAPKAAERKKDEAALAALEELEGRVAALRAEAPADVRNYGRLLEKAGLSATRAPRAGPGPADPIPDLPRWVASFYLESSCDDVAEVVVEEGLELPILLTMTHAELAEVRRDHALLMISVRVT